MSRYFSQPRPVRADWNYDEPMRLWPLSVDEHIAANTGLLDSRGDPIMRAPNPMGFGHDDLWTKG